MAHYILTGKGRTALDHLGQNSKEGNSKILSEAMEGGPADDFNKRHNDMNEMAGVENIEATRGDQTILMELMMFYGRDVNLVQLFQMFKTIHTRDGYKDDERLEVFDDNYYDNKMRDNFNLAIAALKYMGYISATRVSTYIFKKNIFGKPKYYSTNLKINESVAKRN